MVKSRMSHIVSMKISPWPPRPGLRGFSLVELIVVVAIILIVASISAPLGTIVYYREKEVILRENLKAVRKALDDYYEFAKGRSRTLEIEMEESLFLPNDDAYQPDGKTNGGTKYTADEYWDWQYYPLTWGDLYNSGFLRRENAVNPFTNKAEDFDIVVAIPLEYIQDKRIEMDEKRPKFFNLPRYPDETADITSVNGSLDSAVGANIIYSYVPTCADDTGKTFVKYIFTKDEWHRYFVDPANGLPRVDASGLPVTFPFTASSSSGSSNQFPVHSPRIFDIRFPEHTPSLDGFTYYDQW